MLKQLKKYTVQEQVEKTCSFFILLVDFTEKHDNIKYKMNMFIDKKMMNYGWIVIHIVFSNRMLFNLILNTKFIFDIKKKSI
ncbi:hypothetical protein BSK53_00565 [Paenibacillus odorifer]|nr:hypothetical protein BSK53_00565 [Paenibacillus odorifer]